MCNRKKKCDAKQPICQNCQSLKIHCEGYAQRILWEDSAPRIGMRKRGPTKKILQMGGRRPSLRQCGTKAPSQAEERSIVGEVDLSATRSPDAADNSPLVEDEFSGNDASAIDFCEKYPRQPVEVCIEDLLPSSPVRFLSPHPLNLTPLQSLFLDHYLNNFSLKYPTYLDPSNPFLSTLVPLALRSTTVLCAVLAIGGVQTGLDGRADVRAEILALKGTVLRGCRNLLQRSQASINQKSDVSDGRLLEGPEHHSSKSAYIIRSGSGTAQGGYEEDDLMLFASVMMLMVHDKLSGEPCSNLKTHLRFAHQLQRRPVFDQVSTHYRFLRNIFLYNDLLAAIASGTPTLRDYGQSTIDTVSIGTDNPKRPLNQDGSSMSRLASNRYYLPVLLSRIANGSNSITLADIESWDGNMFWLPSFSSTEVTEVISTIEQQCPSTFIVDESENILISEIYRNATRILYYQQLRNKANNHMDLAPSPSEAKSANFGDMLAYEFQIQHFNAILLANLRSLPLGSVYESSLLFPIGIAAMEIRDVGEKAYVLSRLQLLEDRFQLNQFRKFREKVSDLWESGNDRMIGQQFACDAILLG